MEGCVFNWKAHFRKWKDGSNRSTKLKMIMFIDKKPETGLDLLLYLSFILPRNTSLSSSSHLTRRQQYKSSLTLNISEWYLYVKRIKVVIKIGHEIKGLFLTSPNGCLSASTTFSKCPLRPSSSVFLKFLLNEWSHKPEGHFTNSVVSFEKVNKRRSWE